MIGRLDRYMARTFLIPLILCVISVLGLYVVIDLFSQLGDFLEEATFLRGARLAVTYYATYTPLFLSQVIPMITLLAALMALVRLARHNELTTLKACGISFQRTLAPFFVISGALSALLLVDQEYIVPALAMRMSELEVQLTDRGRTEYRDLYAVDVQRHVFLIDYFYPHDGEQPLRNIYMVSYDNPNEFIYARWGNWDDGEIVLQDVVRSTEPFAGSSGLEPPPQAPEVPVTELRLRSSLTPQQLKSNMLKLQFYTIPRLLEIGRLFPHMATRMLLEVHRRLSFCVANVVLLLVAIPFAFQQEGRHALVGIGVSLLVGLGYYFVVMLCWHLGREPDPVLSPVMAGWLPVAAFGGLGAYLFRSMPT